MARTANAAQSSSGAKQTAMATPEAAEQTGRMGADAPRASDRATENTQKLCYIRLNSLLPVRVLIKWGEGPARGANTDRRDPPTTCTTRSRRSLALDVFEIGEQRRHSQMGGQHGCAVQRRKEVYR